MLGDLSRIDGTINGLSFLAGKNRPFVAFVAKNWWIAAIAGVAMASKVRERHKKNELTTYNTLMDLGMVLSPLVGLAMLNQLAANEHALREAASARLQLPPPAPL